MKILSKGVYIKPHANTQWMVSAYMNINGTWLYGEWRHAKLEKAKKTAEKVCLDMGVECYHITQRALKGGQRQTVYVIHPILTAIQKFSEVEREYQ